MDIKCALNEESKKEVDRILKEAGFCKAFPVNFRVLREKGSRDIENSLYRIAKEKGLGGAAAIAEAAGWQPACAARPVEELEECIRQAYPLELVIEAKKGKTKLPTITEFARKFPKQYSAQLSRQRKNGHKTLREIANSVYPEVPDLYERMARRTFHQDISLESIRGELQAVYFERGDISKSGIKASNPTLHTRLEFIARHPDTYHTGSSISEVVSMLTGIPREEIGSGHRQEKGQKKAASKKPKKVWNIGELSEQMTKFLLLLTGSTDPNAEFQTGKFRETFPAPISEVYNSKGCRVYREGEEGFFLPDVVVLSAEPCAVEVKNYKNLNAKDIEKLKQEIGSSKNLYFRKNGTGPKKIDSRVAVLLGPRDREVAEALSCNQRIKTFLSSEFEESLESALENARQELPVSQEMLMQMFRTAAYTPHLISKPSQKGKMDYAIQTLQDINQKLADGEQMKSNHARLFGKNGGEKKNEEGAFQLFKVGLDEIDTAAAQYVRNNTRRIGTKPMLFLDLETTGLSKKDSIISAGVAYRQGNIFQVEIGFARNPWEEAALLLHVNELVKKNSLMVTYNGRSFDAHMLNRRSIANIMPGPQIRNHVDIYADCMRQAARGFGLKNGKLSQIDRMLGCQREDLPGKQVPRIYHSHLKGETPIDSVLEHNAHDMVSLTAAYIFARKELGFRY